MNVKTENQILNQKLEECRNYIYCLDKRIERLLELNYELNKRRMLAEAELFIYTHSEKTF